MDLVTFLRRAFPARSVAALALLIAMGLVEGLSLLTLLPLLALVGVDTGPVGALGEGARTVLGAVGLDATLGTVLGLFVALQLGLAGLVYAHARVALTLQHRLVDQVRRDLREALDHASWMHVRSLSPARVADVMTVQAERAGAATYFVLTMLAGAVVLAVQAALALRVSWPLALGVFAAAGLLIALLRRPVRQAHAHGQDLSRHLQDLHERTLEWLQAGRLTRIHGTNPFPHLEHVRDTQVAMVHHRASSRFLFDALSVVLLAVTAYVALQVLGLATGAFLLLVYLFARILPRANQLHQQWQAYRAASPAWDAQQAMLEDARVHAELGDAEPPAFDQELAVQDVHVAIEGRAALQGVGLALKPGEKTALVGPSGAGKTTLAEVIMGLVAPDRGALLVDGRRLDDDARRAWRRRVAYVPQDAHLVQGTVRDNLHWARPDATEDDMRAALGAAGCDFLAGRGGLDARIDAGNRGYSGGERQRLALAMALVRRPALLVLDEPTSQLDPDAEAQVVAAIERLDGPAVLLISHRDAPTAVVDRVVRMEGGRVSRSG